MTSSFLAVFLAQAQGSSGGGALVWLPLVFIFVIFYFLLILPQQRRQKKWQHMLSEIKTGDRVITSGGLKGTVIALRGSGDKPEDYIHLRVPPDNLRIEVTRSSVVSVSTGDETKTSG
ncbi:MAG: preprotein translocase subunit YajC [Terriglobales bacterium]